MSNELIDIIINVLKNLGYEPEVKMTAHDNYDIYFTSFGGDAFPKQHKDVIRTLAGSKLMEFDYEGCNRQHILIWN
jgi:hypothetical protein